MQHVTAPPSAAPEAPRRPRKGTIEVSPRAIATVASRAIIACPGVVGIASKRLRFGSAELLPPERYAQGIEVRFVGEHIAVDLHVIMEYGLHLPDVTQQAIESVRAAMEHVLGLPVIQVNVTVQGLRVSDRTL
jgi:uncharacterized alkaline shock family protein YloU